MNKDGRENEKRRRYSYSTGSIPVMRVGTNVLFLCTPLPSVVSWCLQVYYNITPTLYIQTTIFDDYKTRTHNIMVSSSSKDGSFT